MIGIFSGSLTPLNVMTTANTAPDSTNGTSSAVVRINVGGLARAHVGGATEGSSSSSDESAPLAKIRKQIKALQKQLLAAQRQLLQAQNSRQSPDAKAAQVATAQAQVASTGAALASAIASMIQALKSAGGSASGSLASAVA